MACVTRTYIGAYLCRVQVEQDISQRRRTRGVNKRQLVAIVMPAEESLVPAAEHLLLAFVASVESDSFAVQHGAFEMASTGYIIAQTGVAGEPITCVAFRGAVGLFEASPALYRQRGLLVATRAKLHSERLS